jgi:hypothetical protein
MSRLPHKLPKVATDQMAVVDGLGNGIQFGPGDLKMLLQRGEAQFMMICTGVDKQPC